jgi:hypothetical protein
LQALKRDCLGNPDGLFYLLSIKKIFMKNIKIQFLILISGILFIQDLPAQSISYKSTDDAYVVVMGTSTLQDWELRSETLLSEIVFGSENGDDIESLERLMFTLEKTSLESDQSRLQRSAHSEMDAENHPQITFRASDGTVRRNGEEYRINATGDLTVSGVTRQVSVEATCINSGNEMVCTGTENLRMTDFNIDPPTLMLGTIRTDDEVAVEFRIGYSR